jgi:hypothetical protein
MIIKKIIHLIPVIFLFISGLCYSQSNDNNKTPEVRARQITDKLNEKLSFKDRQDSFVFNAYQSFFSSMEMLRNFKDGNDETKNAMENARNELDGKMKYILTSDQYDKYSSMVKDMQKNNQNRRGRHDIMKDNKD